MFLTDEETRTSWGNLHGRKENSKGDEVSCNYTIKMKVMLINTPVLNWYQNPDIGYGDIEFDD